MEEKNIIQCKICKEFKERILLGKFDDKNKKWVDATGKLFNGKTCPACHKVKIKENMRKLRAI